MVSPGKKMKDDSTPKHKIRSNSKCQTTATKKLHSLRREPSEEKLNFGKINGKQLATNDDLNNSSFLKRKKEKTPALDLSTSF